MWAMWADLGVCLATLTKRGSDMEKEPALSRGLEPSNMNPISAESVRGWQEKDRVMMQVDMTKNLQQRELISKGGLTAQSKIWRWNTQCPDAKSIHKSITIKQNTIQIR